jgi:cell division protease FtsH
VWTLNDRLPVVFGAGSVLSFLEANPVERVTVIYKPLLWDVSERIILIEAQGKQHAYYPSDMETAIFTDKAVNAPWGGKLVFIPRSELSEGSRELFELLDQRFSGARPAVREGRLEGRRQRRAVGRADARPAGLRRLPAQGPVQVAQVCRAGAGPGLDRRPGGNGRHQGRGGADQGPVSAPRRVCRVRHRQALQCDVQWTGGSGKTKLASFLAKELQLPILFHSAANLETGFVAGGSNTLSRIMSMAKRRKRCIVFLDEAQDLFMKRGGRRKFDDDTANTLLSVLDGVRSRNEAEIIWIVASNFNSETLPMDDAMLRRFQMKVDFRMPNREERLAIISHYLKQRAEQGLPDLDLHHLVSVTEGRSPADLETIVNQAGITAVQAGEMIGADTLMQAAERVLVGNVNTHTTEERERDRRIIAVHEWGHFLVDFEHERRLANGDWEQILADMKTIKISLKANARTNALGFVFHKQGANLLKTRGDIEHDVRVLLGGMANEELFFGESGTTNGAHNDITRVTHLLHHAVGEMGMYRKTRLNFGALANDGRGGGREVDEETRSIMEAQSERLYGETRSVLAGLKPLTEHLAGKLLAAGEMGLSEALSEICRFEEKAARA